MPQFIQKALIKWSTIAVLGMSAYFVGYFWGFKKLEGNEKAARIAASEALNQELNQAAHLGELKERVH